MVKNNWKNSILAGILISIGCIIYSKIGGIVGAVLFSLGLLSIIQNQLTLYTGKCGYVKLNKKDDLINIIKIFIGNLIGVIICFLLVFNLPHQELINIANVKLSSPLINFLPASIFCGMMMHLAVVSKREIITILCVSVFILAGFEHSIADMFYLAFNFSLYNIIIILICAIGNLIGAQIVNFLIRK